MISKDSLANITMKIAFSAYAMYGCVQTFPIRYDYHRYDKEQPDSLDKRENQ
jgi:hypothetical protein